MKIRTYIIDTIKKNSLLALWAAIVASGIFYVVQNPDMFTASILSLQEQQFIKEKQRDIAYKTINGYVDIFVAPHLNNIKELTCTITFDPETIRIDTNTITGQATRTVQEMPGELIIHITPHTPLVPEESLVMIPFSGDRKHIIVTEAKSEKGNHSIGTLNTFISHDNQ